MMIKIGDMEITHFVQDGTIKPLGGTTKRSSTSFPGTRMYSMRHEGIEPRGWSLSLLGVDNQTGLDAVLAAFNDAPEDTRFYPYFATRFARIAQAAAWEALSFHYFNDVWAAEAEVYATIADLFDDDEDTWYPQQNEKHSITPVGTIAAPLDELKIIGNYVNGAHVESPTIEIYDAAGTTLEASVLITDILLTDEELTLDYRGKITQVYTDPFTSAEKFVQDTENIGCSIEGDGLTIQRECSAVWKLSGPWPLTKNIVISTTQISGTGYIYLQYSFDDVVWRTAHSNDLLRAATTWTIPNTAGHSDVYIRFSAYSGGDDENERTDATILSEITSTSRNRDNYVQGVWGKTYNAGDYMLLIKLADSVYAYQVNVGGVLGDWKVGSDYEASVDMYAQSGVTEVTDRSDAQILADIITPSPAKDRDNYVQGVWGRVLKSGSYMLIIALGDGKYAYQVNTASLGTWKIGTDTEAAADLYSESTVGGDRENATILSEITSTSRNRDNYVQGVWGRTYGSGSYMLLIKLDTDLYAYKINITGSEQWYVGSASTASSAFYAACPVPTTRSYSTILAEVDGTVISRNGYVKGVWGRTSGAGGYALVIQLASGVYAYQLHPSSGDMGVNAAWYSGTLDGIATALYTITSGSRTKANILADLNALAFVIPTGYSAYGTTAGSYPKATIVYLENDPGPVIRAYKITTTTSESGWSITGAGSDIANALVSASSSAVSRTQLNILADIKSISFSDPTSYLYTVDGPYTGQKPTAKVILIQNSPAIYAYQIVTGGSTGSWFIDLDAGWGVVHALLAATTTTRTEADILSDISALAFDDLEDCAYTAYGYVEGARPIATVVQVQNSPQVLVYRISQSDGTYTDWLIEANSGADCRAALIAGFTGLSSRTQTDIRTDIINAAFVSPAAYDWQVYGYDVNSKPYANLMLLENSPRIYAYQINYSDTGLSSWKIDESLGVDIAAILEEYSVTATDNGKTVLRSITILQERRIPWRELPLLPLDGLAHCVEIANGPAIYSAYLKDTGATLGLSETFTLEEADDDKIYLKADTGKYLSSPWGTDYVMCIEDSPGNTCEFELIPLGTANGNTVGAIRCTSGQYLSASDDGAGFILATALQIGPTELFEFIDLGSGQWAFKVTSPVATESLELDSGELDASTLDGDVDEASIYAGNYLSAVSGTLTGVNPITATYRDRYSI